MTDIKDPEKEETQPSVSSVGRNSRSSAYETDPEKQADDKPSRPLSEDSDTDDDSIHTARTHELQEPSREEKLNPHLTTLSRTASSIGGASTMPGFEIDWEDNDPQNPMNWPLWYKTFIIFVISYSTFIV
jgi:hypothetical protein